MKNKEIYGRVIEKAGKDLSYDMILEYYLNCESLREEYCDLKRYGITIRKIASYPDGQRDVQEKTIGDLFYRRSDAENFLNMLIAGKVTPVSFREIVEEYIVGAIQ